MKIRVRLYGTLRESHPAGGQPEGIEVEVPQRATAGDLLGLLGISASRGATVVMNGRVIGLEDEIAPGAAVGIFQAIGGG